MKAILLMLGALSAAIIFVGCGTAVGRATGVDEKAPISDGKAESAMTLTSADIQNIVDTTITGEQEKENQKWEREMVFDSSMYETQDYVYGLFADNVPVEDIAAEIEANFEQNIRDCVEEEGLKYDKEIAQWVVDMEEEVQEEAETTKIQAVSPQEIAPPNVEDDVEALVAGEEGLSEDFKKKASTIFEAAVHAKVVDEVNKRMEEQQKEVDASKDEFQKELTEKVDGYLTYVVEEWMKENELAIERGIRSELVEDFMTGLKTLFTEHYIDLPEEKVDMVDDLFTKVEELETSLDEEINRGVELQKELSQFKKDDAIKQTTKDLADADSEKIAKLAEGIEFENTEQYVEKLNVLKESYFPKSEAVTSEITETDENIEVSEEETQKLDESMQHYTSAIRRYNS